MNCVILLAGGNGTRMGSEIPKQHLEVEKHQIIEYTLKAFSASKNIGFIVIVSNKNYINRMENISKKFPKVKIIIPGGKTRTLSTYNAIYTLKDYVNDDDKVIISDAARPCIRISEIDKVLDELDYYNIVTTGVEVYETILKTKNNSLIEIIQRDGVFRQTSPEGYRYNILKKLYLEKSIDDVKKYNNIGIDQMFETKEKIGIIKCSPLNFKITTPEDIKMFESVIEQGFERFINS